MSEDAQQVGLSNEGPWLAPSPVPWSRRLSFYFLYAALALSLFSGHIHLSSLLVIVGFIVVFHVATRPLTSDFLDRFPHYLLITRILLVIMCLCLALAFLPAPPAWRPREVLAVNLMTLLITVGWTVMVMTYLFQARQVRLDTIFSGMAAYFLIAIAFTEFYKVLTFFQPNCFHPPLSPRPGLDETFHLRSLYYSLSTITTVGFGDIQPIRTSAQITSGLEAAAGQLFLAVLIARLVSRHLTTSMEPLAPLPDKPKRPNSTSLSSRLKRRRRK